MDEEQHFDLSLPPRVRKDLELFRAKVFAEMYFLKEEGGRRYKVTNGVRIDRLETSFAYSFDLESELFLAEDSPLTVEAGSKRASGNVLACEEFQITVLLDTDLGEKVLSADIRVEPWKLLEALNERLIKINARNNPIAIKLLRDGPEVATTRPIKEVAAGQDLAKQYVKEQPISVIWGPPGTGKTHTMAEIAIANITAGKSVLVVSHSNISVDGVVSKVAELMRANQLEYLLDRGAVMRYGHVRDATLALDEDVVSYNYALSANPDLKNVLDSLFSKQAELQHTGKKRSREMVEVQRRIKSIRTAVADDEKRCVEHARLVATTVSKLYANRFFDDKKYDLVMFDEVSMAYVPQVVCAAMYATERLVLVGDFRQLAPIAQGRASKEVLSQDIFSYLGIIDKDQAAHYHPWLVMLNEQRRMHPAISSFPNERFYGGLLKNHESVIHGRDAIAGEDPCSGSAMTLVNLRGLYCPSMRNSDNSRFNVLGAIVSFGVALEAAKDGKASVGVIAPYVAQARLIRAFIQDYNEAAAKAKRGTHKIACSTVHQFQGSERDVIVLDTVESYPSARPGVLTQRNENGSVDRLVNVAVTRARGKLLTVGNADYWAPPAVTRENAFAALVRHQRAVDTVLSVRDSSLDGMLFGLDFGPNISLGEKKQAEEAFLADIKKASQRIVISLPDGKLDERFAVTLLRAIRGARVRGVEVLIKCFNTEELPDDWKGYAWQSDNAIFPLAVIDGTVCWYGMPTSHMRVPLKKGFGPKTTMQIPFRITGSNAISMIWSLTSLDTRKTADSTTKLQKREGTTADDEDGKGLYGLARYINEHIKCPKCKAPMKLAKGRRSGKYYLRCTSCDSIDYLDPNDVNHYFCVARSRCPKCGASMQAKVGRYGFFIKCDGRAQHSIKPDEV